MKKKVTEKDLVEYNSEKEEIEEGPDPNAGLSDEDYKKWDDDFKKMIQD